MDPGRFKEIVERAQASLLACEHMLAQAGTTPQACLEAVRRSAGEDAVRNVQRDVEGILRAVRDQVEREASHAPSGHVVSRRVASRGSV
jgi:hypothetical protein